MGRNVGLPSLLNARHPPYIAADPASRVPTLTPTRRREVPLPAVEYPRPDSERERERESHKLMTTLQPPATAPGFYGSKKSRGSLPLPAAETRVPALNILEPYRAILLRDDIGPLSFSPDIEIFLPLRHACAAAIPAVRVDLCACVCSPNLRMRFVVRELRYCSPT